MKIATADRVDRAALLEFLHATYDAAAMLAFAANSLLCRLALKDSPPGFIPTSIESYDEGYETDAYHGTAEYGTEYGQVQYDDGSYQETEQL